MLMRLTLLAVSALVLSPPVVKGGNLRSGHPHEQVDVDELYRRERRDLGTRDGARLGYFLPPVPPRKTPPRHLVGDLSITSFTLINAETNQPAIATDLVDGMTVNLAEVGTALNVRANVPGTPGSVKFQFNADAFELIENVPPFALFGDVDGDYFVGSFAEGANTVKATAYEGPDATGAVGTPLSVTFHVINEAVGQKVTSFTLINANTNEPALATDLVDGMTVNLANIGTTALNIRANVVGDPGSVKFQFTADAFEMIENVPPFALFGDIDGDYNAGELALGENTLTATPYQDVGATGGAGTPLTTKFFVVDSGVPPVLEDCRNVVILPRRDNEGNVVEYYGKTYDEWALVWWNWMLENPTETSPGLDDTGQFGTLDQPDKVFFLAGTFLGDDPVVRTVAPVPKQKPLFFPILNTLWVDVSETDRPWAEDYAKLIGIKHPELLSDEELYQLNAYQIWLGEQEIKMSLQLNDDDKCELNPFHDLAVSPLGSISATDFIPDYPEGDDACVASGYWVLLSGLDEGIYKIHWKASRTTNFIFTSTLDQGFELDVTYYLHVE